MSKPTTTLGNKRYCGICNEYVSLHRFTFFPGRQSYRSYCNLCYNKYRRAVTEAKSRGSKLTVAAFKLQQAQRRHDAKLRQQEKHKKQHQTKLHRQGGTIIRTNGLELTDQEVRVRKDFF